MPPADPGTASRLTIDADLVELAGVRAFVRRRCAELGVPPMATADVVQAIDEAVTNVIVHGYAGSPGIVEVGISIDGAGRVLATVRDAAPAFDPSAVAEPDPDRPLEARLDGGMGVYLMRAAMDDMHHRALPGGGNELTMTRRIDRVE